MIFYKLEIFMEMGAISAEKCVSSQKGGRDFGEFSLIALVSLSNFVHLRKAQTISTSKVQYSVASPLNSVSS